MTSIRNDNVPAKKYQNALLLNIFNIEVQNDAQSEVLPPPRFTITWFNSQIPRAILGNILFELA
jgi:hypothetical protein